MSKQIKFRFRLKMLEESWGSYKKGDIDFFFINLLDEQNGLVRFPIDKHWEIVSCDEFTGFKDSEGNDVYVNDIIKHPQYFDAPEMYPNPPQYGLVEFKDCAFKLYDEVLSEEDLENNDYFYVAGNIYNNLNLLEK
jgi:hypothetical protein